MSNSPTTETRVAVLVDCDNVSPEILEHALRMVAQFGRVVLRRGYGNQATLANKWQDALVRLAFTPCLQYQYAAGKNTADIALALDALEALFDERADTFCLVTSDSDFAYLCRKLRERGATVCIVGEPKTPDALRNASDQFFEWVRPAPPAEQVPRLCSKARGETGASTRRSGQAGASQACGQAQATLSCGSRGASCQRYIGGQGGPWRPRPIPQAHRSGLLSTDLRALRVVEHGQDV